MEPATPTSFIPKRPVATAASVDTGATGTTIGILSLVVVVIIVGTALSYVGVYLYGKQSVQQKESLQKTITQAKDGLGADFISQMKRLNGRIDGVKTLIKQHVVVSPIFKVLQDTTLQSVQYKDFSYQFTNDPVAKADIVKVKLSGTAKGYSTIALQADAFTRSPIIKNPVFSGLSVDDKKRVTFTLNFDIMASDLSYQSFVDGLAKAHGIAMPDVTSPSASAATTGATATSALDSLSASSAPVGSPMVAPMAAGSASAPAPAPQASAASSPNTP